MSSSRKRLVPQVLYKGGILRAWQKKQAIVIQKQFFDTLPKLPETKKENADLAWLLYDLELDKRTKRFKLSQKEIVYTEFESALNRIVTPEPGEINDFIELLQHKLDQKLEDNPPDAPILTDPVLT